MSLLDELNFRASILAHRRSVPELATQADEDERQLLDTTAIMDEHPEGYEGPCWCAGCRAYA